MPTSTEERLEQRAKDPVSRALIRKLIVPWIYFDAAWPDDKHRGDLVAVNRAGTGDVHVVEIKRRAGDALRSVPQLLPVPAQYRWIAFFKETVTPKVELQLVAKDVLYPDRDPGRVGVIELVRMQGDDLGANIIVDAERFAGSYQHLVDAFVAAHEPDVCFR